MKTIAEAAGELAATNCPVLCLDTCVFLDGITTGNRGEADLIGVNRTLLQVLITTPARLQLVVTELVVHEWGQRRDGIFVSTNKADFWEDKNTAAPPHEKLVADFNQAGLRFFGRLPIALRHLGILT